MKIILLYLLVFTASCANEVGINTSDSASSLSGIFDDKVLLRLAKVSSDDASASYRFETCQPSGELCTGAFKNSQGSDVLINFEVLNSLQFSSDEHDVLKTKIDSYHDVQVETSRKVKRTGVIMSIAGTFMAGGGVSIGAMSLLSSSSWQAVLTLASGALLTFTGYTVALHGFDKAAQGREDREDAWEEWRTLSTTLYSLPRYLEREKGLKSTDLNRHQPVYDRESVYWITFVLARELNETLHQLSLSTQGHSNTDVVDTVCFMKDKTQEVCSKVLTF